MSPAGMSVMLCCAEDDEPLLAPVVEHLQAEGMSPQVLPGVVKDSFRLGQAVDNERGKCLFVACKSGNLGPGDVLRLEGVFGARKGPLHKFVGVRLTENPLDMVKDIRTSVTDLANKGNSGVNRMPAGAPPKAMRDVVSMTNISAVGSDHAPAASVQDRLASRETPADPIAVPLTGTAAEHAARVPVHQSGGWNVEAKIDETLSEKKSPLASGANSAAVPPASLLPEPRAPKGSGLMPALMGAILVAVLGVGYLVLRSQDAPEPVPTPAAKETQPVAAPPSAQPKPTPHPGVDPGVDPDASPDTGPESPPTQPPPAPLPAPDETDPEIPVDETTAIAEAIANGDMRALDLILVLKPGEELEWRKAADHCTMKRVRGVKGWRLPTMQELKKLRGARMLKTGRYWSGTQTSKGSDEVYILDQAARKVEVVTKGEPGIQVLCVRQR